MRAGVGGVGAGRCRLRGGACSAIGLHLLARSQLMSSRLAMPLIRMVARPSSTSSCGKAAMALIGESAASS